MLRIFFGERSNRIDVPSIYFNNIYEDVWITSDYGRLIIKDIDESEVISSSVLKNKWGDTFSPRELSAGVKTLFLLKYKPSNYYNASNCGDNCIPAILNVAKEQDICIVLYHMMDFSGYEFEAKIMNGSKSKYVNNMTDYINEASKYLRGTK